MLDRLKQALVQSYAGAIAVGWLFAQAVMNFVNIFADPVQGWVLRTVRTYSSVVPPDLGSFLLVYALPSLVKAVVLSLLACLLLRWLYFKPVEESPEPQPSPQTP